MLNDGQFSQLISGLIENRPSLKAINPQGITDYSRDRIQRLAEAIKVNTTAQQLWLNSLRITDDNFSLITDALMHNKGIKTLFMRYNDLNYTKAKHLSELINANTPLTHIYLQNSSITSQGLECISTSLQSNTLLQYLNLEGTNLGAEGAKTLSDGLRVNVGLRKLILPHNNIGDAGAKHLAEALSLRQGNIAEISIRDNNISSIGANDIIDALKNSTTIKYLTLAENPIDNAATKNIAEMLFVNSSLRSLYLDRTNINHFGIQQIATPLLKHKQRLYKLSIGGNIGDEGVKHIAAVLKVNTNLKCLYINGSTDDNMGTYGAIALAYALRTNRTLVHLSYFTKHELGLQAHWALGSLHKLHLTSFYGLWKSYPYLPIPSTIDNEMTEIQVEIRKGALLWIKLINNTPNLFHPNNLRKRDHILFCKYESRIQHLLATGIKGSEYKNKGEFYKPNIARTFIQDRKIAFAYSFNIPEVLEIHMCLSAQDIPPEIAILILANLISIPGYGVTESTALQYAKSPAFWGVAISAATACALIAKVYSHYTSVETNTPALITAPTAPQAQALTPMANYWNSRLDAGSKQHSLLNNRI